MQSLIPYILSILFGLGLLIVSSNFFVEATANTARQYKISPLITGIVIVGFATSTPEILVGIDSAIKDRVHIAVGNALGSNIANIGLILGITAFFFPFEVRSVTIKKIYILMFVSLLFFSPDSPVLSLTHHPADLTCGTTDSLQTKRTVLRLF